MEEVELFEKDFFKKREEWKIEAFYVFNLMLLVSSKQTRKF